MATFFLLLKVSVAKFAKTKRRSKNRRNLLKHPDYPGARVTPKNARKVKGYTGYETRKYGCPECCNLRVGDVKNCKVTYQLRKIDKRLEEDF